MFIEHVHHADWPGSSVRFPSLNHTLSPRCPRRMGIVVRQYLQAPVVVVCRKCRTHLTLPDECISQVDHTDLGRLIMLLLSDRSFKALTVGHISTPPCTKQPTYFTCIDHLG